MAKRWWSREDKIRQTDGTVVRVRWGDHPMHDPHRAAPEPPPGRPEPRVVVPNRAVVKHGPVPPPGGRSIREHYAPMLKTAAAVNKHLERIEAQAAQMDEEAQDNA